MVQNLQNINIKTRVLFTKFSKHHPKFAIERFNLPGENGGRGFSNTYRRILVTPVRTNPDYLFDVYLSNLTIQTLTKLIGTALLLDSNIRNSVCTPCRRVVEG
jgi:hypothetical protein